MATVSFYQPQNMISASIFFGDVTSYSSSHVSLSYGNTSGTYYGSFSFNSTGLPGGTVTGYDQFIGGSLDYRVTGISKNALTVYNYLNSGNAQGLQQYVLSDADVIYGSTFGDSIQGWSGNDNLLGNSGNDIIKGGAGNDTIDGGTGIDTAMYAGYRSNYTIAGTSTGYTVKDNKGSEGTDTLINVERLQFSDAKVAIDTSGNAGQAYRLYQAAFNRTPDIGGLGYQMKTLDDGWPLESVAQNFINSPEFSATYGSLNTTAFVQQMYLNVLHRLADPVNEIPWYATRIDSDVMSRAAVLIGFSESPENQAAIIGVIQNGMTYSV